MIPRNRRIVDLSAIEHNMRLIRNAVPKTAKVLAVVKADGYGHGSVETARAAIAGGAEMLAVAAVHEGIHLREAGITTPILVLGAVTAFDVSDGIRYGLIQTICSPDMALLCEEAAAALNKQTEVHLKIDTGMGRIGIRHEKERDMILEALRSCSHVKLSGVFTHFSDADGDEDGIRYTHEQYNRFLEMIEPLPKGIIRHCCNSAAIHRFPEMALDMVRAGISLYGYPPVTDTFGLKPCMEWKAVISYVKELDAEAYVSYGRRFKSTKPIRTATVACGYADGYHRACWEKGYVLIRGRKAKILGRVCMDQLVADISGIENVQPGEEAVLMGESGNERITAEDLAEWAGTISYEILCSSAGRVERIYTESNTERSK
ncbi:MAG: alanine racemase [Clostridia bacterium]|nr:alanine racemase [Clostridia bacterium]